MNKQTERDYAITDPRSSDWDGTPVKHTVSALMRDYPEGHPKAADSPQNIAESAAFTAERSQSGQPGVPLPVSEHETAASEATVAAADAAAAASAAAAAAAAAKAMADAEQAVAAQARAVADKAAAAAQSAQHVR